MNGVNIILVGEQHQHSDVCHWNEDCWKSQPQQVSYLKTSKAKCFLEFLLTFIHLILILPNITRMKLALGTSYVGQFEVRTTFKIESL